MSDDAVSIEHIDGQWAVQVLEAGKVTQRLFETEEYARNFAAGQRLRLNPPPAPPKTRRPDRNLTDRTVG